MTGWDPYRPDPVRQIMGCHCVLSCSRGQTTNDSFTLRFCQRLLTSNQGVSFVLLSSAMIQSFDRKGLRRDTWFPPVDFEQFQLKCEQCELPGTASA